MPEETTSSLVAVASEILLLLGLDPRATSAGDVSLEALRKCTREQLIEYARRLGLSGVAKLNKELLAGRIQSALDRSPSGRSQPDGSQPGSNGANDRDPTGDDAPPESSTESGLAPFPEKFDLGPGSQEEPTPHHIPWSYGQNRVTAMVVDPEKMFAYWECTDAGIDNARRGLGQAGGDAWLNLRIYDVTGRLFDGTNAHSYFDHRIERSDRQWFFFIGKPTSMACVELGLKSPEGYFVKICRSGRIEFPPRGPAGSNHVEWLTVDTSTGTAGQPVAGAPPGPGGGGAFGGGTASQRGLHGVPDLGNGGAATVGPGAPVGPHVFERRWEWREAMGGGVTHTWTGERTQVEWIGPLIRSAWEAGPFTYAVQSPAYVEEWNEGTMTVRSEHGQVQIVYGPWQVVIRGIGAHAERRVLATWEIRRSWATTVGVERAETVWRSLAPGSSEWVAQGGSERMWMGGSELRLGGASELFLVGASELRLGGASEARYSGASEWMMRGASERVMRGASEWLLGGASENMYAGASEQMYAGASEMLMRGASEQLFAGASERLGAGFVEPTLEAPSVNYPASLGGDAVSQPPAYPVKR
jgi:hypothetical protein